MGSVLIVQMYASEPATSPPPTPHGPFLFLQTNHKDFNFYILENLKLMKLVY